MTTTPGLEPARVSAWLSSLDLGEQGAFSYARIGDGQSNLTYLVSDEAGQRWVLRRPPLGVLLVSAHDVAREHRVMSALAQGSDVPVARPLALTTDPAVCDAPLMVMTHVDGLVIDRLAVAETVPPERRHEVGISLATVLGQVHDVDLDSTGLTTLGSHSPYAARQVRRWRRQWDGTGLRTLDVVHELADRFERAAPPQREVSLVHGDFHLLNVITSTADGQVLAVLDWELCTLGDPLADLGGLLAYWPEARDAHAETQQLPGLPGFPTQDELVAQYAKSTGRDVSDVGYWHALACWKIAVIGEGVRARALAEPLNRAGTTTLDTRFVDALLARAERVADESGVPH